MTVKLWEVSTGYEVRTFAGHSDWVKCVAVSLDGLYFASSGIDQSILVWQLSTGLKVQVISVFQHPLVSLLYYRRSCSSFHIPHQTLLGHEHVVESLCYGKRPVDAAAIMAAAAKGGEPATSPSVQRRYNDLSDILHTYISDKGFCCVGLGL